MVIGGIGKGMMKDRYSPEHCEISPNKPQARYAYYRRCQMFRKSGEQCKAPAEKRASICHAHAGQQAMALRRERERQAVLAEAVAEIRRKGRPEFQMVDLFIDFEGIQVTLAVVARALLNDRIDCKTAGRLLVDLQTVSKLLRMHNKGLKTLRGTKALPLVNTDNTDLKNRITETPTPCREAWRHPFNQDRTGLVGNHEEAPESRSKVVVKRADNAASAKNSETRNTKVIEIRSTERAPSLSLIFCRHGPMPTLLTG
jgi:hypothetical protein